MAGGRLGGMRGGCGEWLVMGRGTSLATTEDHCSESWAFLGTGMDKRPDGHCLVQRRDPKLKWMKGMWISK